MKTPVHLFNVEARRLKAVHAQDEGGGVVTTYEPATTTFRCRVRIANLRAGIDKTRPVHGDTTEYRFVLYCSPSVQLSPADRISIDGRTFRIHGSVDLDGMGALKVARLEALE